MPKRISLRTGDFHFPDPHKVRLSEALFSLPFCATPRLSRRFPTAVDARTDFAAGAEEMATMCAVMWRIRWQIGIGSRPRLPVLARILTSTTKLPLGRYEHQKDTWTLPPSDAPRKVASAMHLKWNATIFKTATSYISRFAAAATPAQQQTGQWMTLDEAARVVKQQTGQ